ncbi:MAG: DNA-binding transcriptional regulator [Kiritimatiellia bacterium]
MPHRKHSRAPQVAVLLPSSVKICRDIRRGILRYVHQHGPWGLHILEGRDGEQKLTNMKKWGCTGIIIRPGSPELDSIIMRTSVPAVLVEDPNGLFLSEFPPNNNYSVLRSDTQAIGNMAAAYFLKNGFKNFAYVGEIHGIDWSLKRGDTFVAAIEKAGYSCRRYGALANEDEDAGVERDRLCGWLTDLSKPVALLAAMDNRARQVIDACNWAGINVPSEIAVLGVDNDKDLCENENPPMSSILLDAERAGYDVAAYLDRMMREGFTERKTFRYGPSHVVSRKSTASFDFADPVLKKALDYIKANACNTINIPEIAEHACASRRLLELRFRNKLGHTILEEIRKVRLEHVCTLLKESDKSIGEITAECGFESESYLGVIFRRKFGCTMRDYRKQG